MTEYYDSSMIAYTAAGETEAESKLTMDYKNSTYTIVSKIAYLIGVPEAIFRTENLPPQPEWFDKLKQNKNARIIRNLCMLRTAIEQHYGKIYNAMYYDTKNLHTLPEYIPQDAISALEQDGISIIRSNILPAQYIKDINKHIADRINNCKELIPIWIKWDYVKALFIMPKGLNDEGIKRAAEEYYANKSAYPYSVYINWPGSARGNILYNDKKFVTLLYEVNEDCFTDLSKVSDAGNIAKSGIYKYLGSSERVVMMVDCENSDPYKLCATLTNLDQEALLSKISKIVLFDDVNAASAWAILEQFTAIPIEYVLIERIKENKSLVDIRLAASASREHYRDGVNAFILVSSDSDYWGLITELPDADFLVMVEYSKCGPDIKNALVDRGFKYCYIDDFCTGNSNEIKITAVLNEVQGALNDCVCFNIKDILEDAYRWTRAEMSPSEKKQFYERYIKNMKLTIRDDGEVYIDLGKA